MLQLTWLQVPNRAWIKYAMWQNRNLFKIHGYLIPESICPVLQRIKMTRVLNSITEINRDSSDVWRCTFSQIARPWTARWATDWLHRPVAARTRGTSVLANPYSRAATTSQDYESSRMQSKLTSVRFVTAVRLTRADIIHASRTIIERFRARRIPHVSTSNTVVLATVSIPITQP